jgi:hypothetical protein
MRSITSVARRCRRAHAFDASSIASLEFFETFLEKNLFLGRILIYITDFIEFYLIFLKPSQ